MTRPSPDPLRRSVRRELRLPSAKAGAEGRARFRRRPWAPLRAVALLALLGGPAEPLWAQAPFRQELLPGISSLLAGEDGRPELADLDGDGDFDLVVGVDYGTLAYFVNAGSSTAPLFLELTGSANPFMGIDVGYQSEPVLADLDGDGDLDAVVGELDGTLRTFENSGSSLAPVFVEATGTANPFDGVDVGVIASPALADLDGDGDLDAAIGHGAGVVAYFANTGSSAVPAFVEATGTANPFLSFGFGGYASPEFADLDADGDLDAAVGHLVGTLYLSNTGGSTAPAFTVVTGSASPFFGFGVSYGNSPVLADLDGDGDLDGAIGTKSGSLLHIVNTGGSATPAFAVVTGSGSLFGGLDVGSHASQVVVDLDGDADLDVVLGARDGLLRYVANTGDSANPSFVQATGSANPFDGIDIGGYSAPELADLDGDGDLDAVVGEVDGTLKYFANTGSSASPAFFEATGSANPFDGIAVGGYSCPELADLDGDGDLDAVLGEYDGILSYYVNTGSSTSPAFLEATGSANPFAGIDVEYYSTPHLVDFDGDGDLDALVGEVDWVLNYFANTGSSAVPAFVEVTGSASPFATIDAALLSAPPNLRPALMDIDTDGDLDLLAGDKYGRVVYYRSLVVESLDPDIFADDFEGGDLTAWSNF